MIRPILLSADQLPRVWLQIAPMVEAICDASSGKIAPSDVLRDAACGTIVVWVGLDEVGIVKVILIGNFIDYPRLRAFNVVGCVGEDLPEWLGLLDIVERWAINHGAVLIEGDMREGWTKILRDRGYRRAHVHLEKALA